MVADGNSAYRRIYTDTLVNCVLGGKGPRWRSVRGPSSTRRDSDSAHYIAQRPIMSELLIIGQQCNSLFGWVQ
jgi:hypothetical protein